MNSSSENDPLMPKMNQSEAVNKAQTSQDDFYISQNLDGDNNKTSGLISHSQNSPNIVVEVNNYNNGESPSLSSSIADDNSTQTTTKSNSMHKLLSRLNQFSFNYSASLVKGFMVFLIIPGTILSSDWLDKRPISSLEEIEVFLPQSAKEAGVLLTNAPINLQTNLRQLGLDFTVNPNYQRSSNTNNSTTFSSNKIIDYVSKGDLKIGYVGPYYSGKLSLYFSTAIPFGLTPHEQNAWLNYRPSVSDYKEFGQKYGREEGEKYIRKFNELSQILGDGEAPSFVQVMYFKSKGVIAFPIASTGSQMGGFFKHEIEMDAEGKLVYKDNTEGEKTIVMRIPALGKTIMRRLGVEVPEDISIDNNSEKIHSNETKINALEWIGPYDDQKMDFFPSVKNWYYYSPGWWEPSTVFYLVVNPEAWSKLNSRQKAIFRVAVQKTYTSSLQEHEQKNIEATKDLKKGNIKFRTFDHEMLEAARDEVKNKLAIKQQGDDEDTQEFRFIYKVWSRFGNDLRQWSRYQSVRDTNLPPQQFPNERPSTFNYDVFGKPGTGTD